MELHIEKLIYGGDRLARLPADERGLGKAVFVPFVLSGETVEASVTDEKPGFARATVDRILEPSRARIAAPCPYFQRCGGCHYQHTTYAEQLEIKKAILRENLSRLAKLKLETELVVHPSPPWNYRNRTRLQVRTDPEFTLGYFRMSSHVLLPVEECPISSPLINRAIKALWELGRAGHLPAELQEIELFADADDASLLVELYFDSRRDLAERLRAGETATEELLRTLPKITSVYAFAQTVSTSRGTQGHISEEPEWTYHPGEFQYRTKTASFRVSGGSFFQINRFLVDELVSIVTGGCSGKLALDLYAGVGLFNVNLAAVFDHTVAVEWSQSSATDLKYNCPPNVKAVRSPADTYLAGKGARLRPELAVADPPRSGLGERVAKALVRLGPPRIRYVSCDPATLARDLFYFRAGGYRVPQVHLVDLFPQTYHIETVVELVR